MEPLVSVIVPIYKVEEYLPRCLDSIIGQTYRNLEIILVDDGSPDNCGAICDQYAAQDNRIRVIHQENQGVALTRNTGLDAVNGDYLMFVDPDDWINPDAVQLMYERIIQDCSDIAIGDIAYVWPDGKKEEKTEREKQSLRLSFPQMLQFLKGNGTIPCFLWGKLYHSSIFEGLRFPAISRAEDVWMLPHIIEKSTAISIIPDIVYYYYQRDSSIVHMSGDMEHLDSMKALLHVARVLYDNKLIINAGAYYYNAVNEGRKVRNKIKVKKLLTESFTVEERSQIAGKWYVHWRFFLPDNVYLCLRRMKHLILDGIWIR